MSAAVAERPGDPVTSAWPVWDGQRRRLARYVVPEALRGLALGTIVPDRDLLADVRQLYARLLAKQIEYALQPWTAHGFQQIRHPRWILDETWGTCIDLSLMFAAMCLEADLRPLVAVNDGHAFVVVDVSLRLSGQAASVLPGDTGVSPLDNALLARVEAGELVPLDCVQATRASSLGFEEACRAGRSHLGPETMLVDVAELQRSGAVKPEGVPLDRPALGLYMRGGLPPDLKPYEAQQESIDQLRSATGTIALIAPSGYGKSTIAMKTVEAEPRGSAWFLNASELKTLAASLADAELAELNREAAGTTDADRRGFADAAIERLREAEGRWIVVLDNADGAPSAIQSLLPAPGPRQLVLITTTERAWADVPGVRAIFLDGLRDHEVTERAGSAELVPLVAGRPLLLEGFHALMGSTTLDGATIAPLAAEADLPTEELRGSLALWRAARASGRLTADAVAAALLMAYLPPGQQPLAGFKGTLPDVASIAQTLQSLGLVSIDAADGYLRMHRLIGAAIRHDLAKEDPLLDERTVLLLANEQEILRMLDQYGDLATIERIDDRLRDADEARSQPDERLGIALHGIAWLLELHGQTRSSEQTYALAGRHLADRPDLRADILHSMARTVNQQHASDEQRLREALRWAREAEQLLVTNQKRKAEAARCVAMQGLLMQKLAKFPREGETTLELLKEALAVIQEAHDRRLDALESNHPELARSQFNLAGIRINLAKAEPEHTRQHLDAAEKVYREVWERRRDVIYRREVHAHIAACIIGLAYVDYFRALLLPEAPEQRGLWLRSSTKYAHQALLQREQLDGLTDGDESRKAARFLAKVALLRHAGGSAPIAKIDAVGRELATDIASAAVPRFPSGGDALPEALVAWVRSTPVEAIVSGFGGAMPPESVELGHALTQLLDQAARWGATYPAPEVAELVMRSARALGYVGTGAPMYKHYDRVVLAGGSARSALAQVLRLKRLVEADSSIGQAALAAVVSRRPLAAAELALCKELGLSGVSDETGLMRAALERHLPGRDVELAGEDTELRSGLSDGQRIIVIAEDLDAPTRHADFLGALGLAQRVEVQILPVWPGQDDPRLDRRPEVTDYLGAVQATLRSLQRLEAGLRRGASS